MSLDHFTKIKEIPVELSVVAAIWGHGGLPLPETNTPDDDNGYEKMDVDTPILNKPIKIFRNKHTNLELNILGFAPSGFCTVGSIDTETELDAMLTNDPSRLTPSFLTNMYLSESKRYRDRGDIKDTERISTLKTSTNPNLFSYVKNFGKTAKPRSDKLFTGANSEKELENRINGLTTKGPLLKIYNVVIKNVRDNSIVYRDNEVKFVSYNKSMYLSEITDNIYTFATEFLEKRMFYRNYKIVIDLFDPLCNFTNINTPLVAYLDNVNTRSDFAKGNITTTPGIRYHSGGKTRRKQKKNKKTKNRK